MKLKKTMTALVLSLALFGAFTLVSQAASGLQEIKAYLNSGITLKLDGEAQVLTDASGVRTYPITYNGTTYLPIRSIGNLLGVEVNWDQATKSVLLGKSKGVDLIDTYKAYSLDEFCWQVQSADKKNEDISGIACSHWLKWEMGAWNKGERAISFNLLGKHDTLTFSYYADNDLTLKVLGDNGSVLGEFAISGKEVAKTVTVPLLKTSELTFLAVMDDGTHLSVFNAYLDGE